MSVLQTKGETETRKVAHASRACWDLCHTTVLLEFAQIPRRTVKQGQRLRPVACRKLPVRGFDLFTCHFIQLG
jgi:hypothetical protein